MSVRLKVRHLDLDQTLGCGQAFRWTRSDTGTWQGAIGDAVVTLRREGVWLHADSLPRVPDLRERVDKYLRLEDDTERIIKELSQDPVMARGARSVMGLRLVKMDEWECLASYVLATFTNIKRITRMIDRLSSDYGEPIAEGVRTFPSIEELARATARDLRARGLGFRAEYLAGTCRAVNGGRLDEMRRMPDDELRRALRELPGVGEKVADCVMLFGFGRLGAFPIDVWVRRALSRLYGVDGTYRSLQAFAADRFGQNAGYAQEYMFYNERVLRDGSGCAFTRPDGSSCRTP